MRKNIHFTTTKLQYDVLNMKGCFVDIYDIHIFKICGIQLGLCNSDKQFSHHS